MFYKFKKGKQTKLINEAILKAGSERKLSKVTGIPKSSIHNLKFEKRNLSELTAEKIFKFLKISKKDVELNIAETLSDNWGRIKGGLNLIKIKREKGILDQTILNLNKASSKYMKEWHKLMKENEPEMYYVGQYEKFKKVGKGYTFVLENGTKVRNLLEKEVGDFLIKICPKIKYEHYLNISGKAYFPDFLYKDKIIEVTEWSHPGVERINYLKKKIEDYQKEGYFICFFIPKKFRKFYKELDNHIISDLLALNKFIMPP